MIEARGLVKRYGEIEAVAGVDLDIGSGELFGLIGHNGAGKSTTFRLLLGLERPTAGEVRLEGHLLHGRDFRAARRRLGYLPENVVLYDNLTGLETLQFFASLKGAPRADCAAVLERTGLAHAAHRRVRGYSKGMRQRLGFAQALLGSPSLLFLDEPTNGLDPQGIHDFYRTLADLQGQGVTIVLTSHILAELQERVTRLAIMRNGRVHAQGSVQGLRETLDLPLWLDLRLGEGGSAALRQLLDTLLGAELHLEQAKASVRCPRRIKMAALQALAGLGALVTDLHVREPSLEDVLLAPTL